MIYYDRLCLDRFSGERNGPNSLSTIIKKLALRFFAGKESDLRNIYASHAAFYVVVSSIPMLLLIFQLFARTAPENAEYLIARLLSSAPEYVANTLPRDFLSSALDASVSFIPLTALTLFWSSSKGMLAVYAGVRAAYGAEGQAKLLRRYITALLFTVFFLLVTVFALWVLVLGPGISEALARARSVYVDLSTLITRLGWLLALGIFTFSFALMYRFMAETPLPYRKHLPGALFAGAGWLILSGALSLYLHFFQPYTLYGGLGALLLLMLWVRLCMSVLLLGAQVNVFFHEHPPVVSLPK